MRRDAPRRAHRRVGQRRRPPAVAAEPPRRRLSVLRRRPRSARAVRRALVRQPVARARARRRRRLRRRRGRRRSRRCLRSGPARSCSSRRSTTSRWRASASSRSRKVVDVWADAHRGAARPARDRIRARVREPWPRGGRDDRPSARADLRLPVRAARARARAATRRQLRGVPRGRGRARRRRAHRRASTATGWRGCRSRRATRTACGSRRARTSGRSPRSTTPRATTSRGSSSTRSVATTGCGPRPTGRPFPVPHVVPPGAGERRRRLARPRAPRAAAARAGRPALRRVGRARQRHAVEPGRARGRGAGAARCLSRPTLPRARARQPDRRPGRLPRGVGRLDGDRPRRRRHRAAPTRRTGRSRDLGPDLAGVVDSRGRRNRRRPPRSQPDVGPRRSRGVVRVLADLGRAPVGADLDITSTVPIGGGLSSSAAFSVAVALALNDVAGFALAPLDLALAAQRSEHVATGVPCGTQDPLASVFGRAGHALLIDCRTLEIEPLPLPDALRVLVVHSGVPRTLEGDAVRATARREHRGRRRGSASRALRDATFEQVRDEPRGRHAVTEMARVRAFGDALRAGDIDALGPLMLGQPRVVARRHGGVDAGARRARRVPRRRGRARRPPHRRGLRRLRRRAGAAERADAIADAATAAYRHAPAANRRRGSSPPPTVPARPDQG